MDRELWTSWGHRRMQGLHEHPMVQTVLLWLPADLCAILNVLGPYQGKLKAQYWSLCQSYATPLISVILWATCLDIWAFLNTGNFLWGLSEPRRKFFFTDPLLATILGGCRGEFVSICMSSSYPTIVYLSIYSNTNMFPLHNFCT